MCAHIKGDKIDLPDTWELIRVKRCIDFIEGELKPVIYLDYGHFATLTTTRRKLPIEFDSFEEKYTKFARIEDVGFKVYSIPTSNLNQIGFWIKDALHDSPAEGDRMKNPILMRHELKWLMKNIKQYLSDDDEVGDDRLRDDAVRVKGDNFPEHDMVFIEVIE